MLDFIFWTMVVLVLWFSWDSWKFEREQIKMRDKAHLRMETINGSQEEDGR